MELMAHSDGQTPLDEEEKEGLRLPLTTREDLDEFEQKNVEKAVEWALKKRFRQDQILSEAFIKQLHRRMFGDVWKWAGTFRETNKNLGVDWFQIGIQVRHVLDDVKYWIENQTFPQDEIAIRFKHRLVSIHCFANGNGRHSRLMADILVNHVFQKTVFSWGSTNLTDPGQTRQTYISAVKQADNDELNPLIRFSRS